MTLSVVDDSLVRSCVANEAEAWRAMHRRYYPIAVAFLRKLGAKEEDLEDACQEVFLELYRNLSQFRGQSDFKTWLYRLCATQVRRANGRSRLWRLIRERFSAHDDEPTTVMPATITEASLQSRAAEALARMNDGDRLVFVLYEFEGLAGKQIAEVAGCPEATVWRRLHYARRTFRDAFGFDALQEARTR